jgi:hypothetical protein
MIRAHRRQYVLARAPFLAAEDWVSETLASGHVLSRCPELRRGDALDAEGGRWVLLGRAVPTEAGRPDPLAEIADARTEAVATLAEDWTGRWLLIGPRAVLPDAGALLGCLHGRGDDGALLATSSPALGRRIGRAQPRATRDARTLRHERGVSWTPPPLTRLEGLRRLLPSQSLDLATGEVRPRRLVPPLRPEGLDAVAARLAARLATALGHLAAEGPPHLGLTGGADSRVLLAVAVAAGVPVRTFTRHTSRMSVADRVLPPRLAAAAGMPHEVHLDRPPTGDRHTMLEAHCGGGVSAGDALPFLAGTRDALSGLLVGGHGFALATGFGGWHGLPPAPVPADRLARFLGEPPDGPAAAGLAAWLDWIARAPEAEMDWRDRLYVEQRAAGWLAAKEQVYDMQDAERVPLLNGAAIHADLLSAPVAQRRAGALQAAMVARAAPALAAFPANPPDWRHLREAPAHALHGMARRLRARLPL